MKRSPIKSIGRFGLFFLSFLVVVVIAVNVYLIQAKATVCGRLQPCLPPEITAGGVLFLPPDGLVLRHVVLREPGAAAPMGRLSSVIVRLSWPNLIINRKIVVNQIAIVGGRVQYDRFRDLIYTNGERIIAFLKQLPHQDFRFVLRNVSWEMRRPHAAPDLIGSRLDLKIRGGRVQARGWLLQRPGEGGLRGVWKKITGFRGNRRERRLRFRLDGTLGGDDFILTGLVFQKPDFHSRLWGDLSGGILRLNGFVFLKTDPLEKDHAGKLSVVKRLLASRKHRFSTTGFKPDVFLLDLDARCRLNYPEVLIDRFTFSLNNMPMSLTGAISFDKPFRSDLALSFRPDPGDKGYSGNIGEIQCQYHGRGGNGRIVNNGTIDVYFTGNRDSALPLKKFAVSLNDFVLKDDKDRNLNLNVPDAAVTFTTPLDEHRVFIKDVRAALIYRTECYKYVQIRSPFYDGKMYGRIWLDKGARPIKVTSILIFKDVDAHILDTFMSNFTKVYGRLSSRVAIKNNPAFHIQGAVNIRDGRLNDYEFFKWLADTFHLPSLRSVGFRHLSSEFFVSSAGYGLDDIRLQSPDVSLDGFFHVSSSRLVSSMISLTLSRGVLQESPRFTPLLRMFDKSVASLVFDFQLSGSQDAINFRWMQSDFKRRIQERIPDFIERKIQKGIDAILAPLPENVPGPAAREE